MIKPVRIFIILILAITGFDAARPYVTGDVGQRAPDFNERTEFWSFVAFVAILAGVVVVRKFRSRK